MRVIVQHLVVRIVLLALVFLAAVKLLTLDVRPAILIALALVIPPTGFILDSLPAFGLTSDEAFWVKNKAIATELLAGRALRGTAVDERSARSLPTAFVSPSRCSRR